jgi:hypothetical protein
MSKSTWKQVFPHPNLDPGFRVDPRGRARFQVDGFPVDVAVTYLADYTDEVEVITSITLNGVKVAEVAGQAEWGEYYVLRDVLEGLLGSVVEEARHTVRKLAERVAEIDRREGSR